MNEQKEQRQQKKGLNNTSALTIPSQSAQNAPEDMLEYLNSLLSDQEGIASSFDSTGPSESPSETSLQYLWPNFALLETPRECTLCPSAVVRSDLEAVSHVMCSKEHSMQAKMLTSGSQVEELKRHLVGIFKISNKVMKEGETENEKSMREEKMMKAREALEKM